jgi:DNA-binding NarL/FixJ family response regulator
MSIRVLIADDHCLFRWGVRSVLEREGYEVVAEAADGRRAVQLAGSTAPDVAVLDVFLPLLNGLDAASNILRESRGIRPVLLTAYINGAYVREALRAGIAGYVSKFSDAALLARAVHEVCRGATFLCPDATRAVIGNGPASPAPDPLTLRERQVLQLIVEGNTTRGVASILGITSRTAESHRKRINSKLKTRETAGLVRYAVERAIIRA